MQRLKEGGIERSTFGEKIPFNSLRHFYAVNALRNGVGVFEVARNMGTSVEIIQEYYGKQATAAVFATRLVSNEAASGGKVPMRRARFRGQQEVACLRCAK